MIFIMLFIEKPTIILVMKEMLRKNLLDSWKQLSQIMILRN